MSTPTAPPARRRLAAIVAAAAAAVLATASPAVAQAVGARAASAGTLGTAQEVAGTGTLNAVARSVSCASAGNCTAAGSFSSSSGGQSFVVSETNGSWGTAREVPGTAALNQGGAAETLSLSCTPPGTCAAGGLYSDSSGHLQAFVVTKT
jgi:hypothetical protein